MEIMPAASLPASGWLRARMTFAAGVIERARRRRRRRRARFVGLALAAIAAGTIAYLTVNAVGTSRPVHAGGENTFVRPDTVLDPKRPPYMGVACPMANSIACDRVGLAIWLRRPAVSVTATIAGQPLKLDWMGDRKAGSAIGRRKAFDGFLQPAGIDHALGVRPEGGSRLWFGRNQPSPPVRLRIHYSDGTAVITRLRVPLDTGWG